MAGTINVGGGYLVVKTTALSGDSAVARLMQACRGGTAAAITDRADGRAKYHTPLVVLGAILIGTVPDRAWGRGTGLKYFKEAHLLLLIAVPTPSSFRLPPQTRAGWRTC